MGARTNVLIAAYTLNDRGNAGILLVPRVLFHVKKQLPKTVLGKNIEDCPDVLKSTFDAFTWHLIDEHSIGRTPHQQKNAKSKYKNGKNHKDKGNEANEEDEEEEEKLMRSRSVRSGVKIRRRRFGDGRYSE